MLLNPRLALSKRLQSRGNDGGISEGSRGLIGRVQPHRSEIRRISHSRNAPIKSAHAIAHTILMITPNVLVSRSSLEFLKSISFNVGGSGSVSGTGEPRTPPPSR